MAVNKVIYGGETLIDLTGDTVMADKLFAGYTAHAANGTEITGTHSLTDDSYVWAQYNGDPSVPIETAKTNVSIITYVNSSVGYLSVDYADSVEIVDGAINLVDPVTLSLGKSYSQASVDVLIGKYVKTLTATVYIPEDAALSMNSSDKAVYASSAKQLSVRQKVQYATSQDSDAYPANGKHTDGYWYVYKGLLSDLIGDGGGIVTLQEKTVTPSEAQQTVTPDSGYDGLSAVTVDAVSDTYIGSSVPKKTAATYTPGTVDQTIAASQYLDGAQTIKGDANLAAGNIKSGISIFGVSGSYSGESGGSGANNCEAYHITAASAVLSFQNTTGTIQAWGYGAAKGTYTTTVYAFCGSSYYKALSYGTPTATGMSLSLNANGTLSGLPSDLTALDLIITRGI